MKNTRIINGMIAVMVFCVSTTVGASELRQKRYVNESPTVVWKESVDHVICDKCDPIVRREWSVADFARKIVKIKVPTKPVKKEKPTVKKLSPQKEKPEFLYFAFNSAVLEKTSIVKLRAFAKRIKSLKENTAGTIEISGYTDGVGPRKYNDKLASKRAHAVYRALIGMGVPERNMKVKSRGKCCYVDSDVTSGKNRRVKVIHRKEGSRKPS